MNRKSFEHIKLKSSKLEPKQNFKHEDFVAGIAPNLRGTTSTMHARKPWEINQYIGFSTTEECNAFYRWELRGILENPFWDCIERIKNIGFGF